MTDIAELAFRVQTSELDQAAQKLDKVKAAAAGVSSAAASTASAVEGSASRINNAKVSMARADQAAATAMLKRLQLNKDATQEELAGARALQQKTKLATLDAIAEQRRAKALMDATAAQKASNAAQRTAFGSVSGVGLGSFVPNGPRPINPSVPRDQQPNRFNTGNIAAQFQDIGVTAAMGMNPLTIALQQGTQLSAILNTMDKPLQGLAIALKSVFNAVSLGTIAFVAIIAALIQFVNWTTVAKNALYGLASAIQFLAPYVMGIVVLLALFYSEAIIAGIASVTTSIIAMGGAALAAGAKMALAWVLALSPLQLIILGIAAVALALQVFGINAFGYIKTAVNSIIGAFVGAFEAVKATWKMLPAAMGDIVISTANIVLKKISDMINGFIAMINGLIDKLPDWAKPDGGGKITWQADIQLNNPFEGQAAAAGKIAGEEFKKAMDVDYVGNAQKAAQSAADSIAGKIRNFANGIGEGGKKKKDPWEELVKGAERKIATLNAEAAAVGMSAEAAAKLKYETELLNEAQQKNIKLTPQQKARIDELATGMADAEVKAKRLKEAYDFGKEAARGFFQDMKQGLMEGKSLWESFGNAVTNVLNKIFDKILNSGVDMIFDALFKSGSGGGAGGSGFLSSIGEFLFGGANAKGNAFGGGGVMAFANGGAFTNSIVSRTTPFAFASGGKFGVMGEAGPEAVMPLHRGPDGSLGVRSSGGDNGGGIAVVNVNNYGNSKVTTEQRQTSRGLELDVMIDQATATNLSRQGSETNRALNTFNNRQLISR